MADIDAVTPRNIEHGFNFKAEACRRAGCERGGPWFELGARMRLQPTVKSAGVSEACDYMIGIGTRLKCRLDM